MKEGDKVDLNGLHLEIFEFHGHTPDLIGILDKNNRILFSGDAVINQHDQNTFLPVY
ncbi:MAG: MBL fold metallo-hydrolase [Promethearchaeota archaeon]